MSVTRPTPDPRDSCGIEIWASLLVTGGGHPALSNVSLFSREGYQMNQGNLQTARYRHACGRITSDTGRDVSRGNDW